MEVAVEHLGSVQVRNQARQHTIVSDQPPENSGFDEGMTRRSCSSPRSGPAPPINVAEYLRQKGLATEGTRVKVIAEKVLNPPV